MSRRGHRRPPDVPATLRKAGRAVEKVVRQAPKDIAAGVRAVKPAADLVVGKVREGVRKIKRATKR
mgnify:CR=1 FL=1